MELLAETATFWVFRIRDYRLLGGGSALRILVDMVTHGAFPCGVEIDRPVKSGATVPVVWTASGEE